jgi:hypothetical protein
LQAERAAAVLALTGAADADLFLGQTAATDAAAQAYTDARQGLPGLPRRGPPGWWLALMVSWSGWMGSGRR